MNNSTTRYQVYDSKWHQTILQYIMSCSSVVHKNIIIIYDWQNIVTFSFYNTPVGDFILCHLLGYVFVFHLYVLYLDYDSEDD